jgi:hypothetical protein
MIFFALGAMLLPASFRAGLAAQSGPLAATAERLARADARQPPDGATAPSEHGHVSRAEKIAWAYLLIGGSVFIATSPGEKGGDGRWSDDGKWELAGGIGAVAISFALLHDMLTR